MDSEVGMSANADSFTAFTEWKRAEAARQLSPEPVGISRFHTRLLRGGASCAAQGTRFSRHPQPDESLSTKVLRPLRRAVLSAAAAPRPMARSFSFFLIL